MKEDRLEIRIYLSEGTTETFELRDAAQIQAVRQQLEPLRVFAQNRLVVAGETFKSVFVTTRVLRMDFVHPEIKTWDFPSGYADIVELTAEEFRQHAHVDEPELRARRDNCIPVGDLLVSFLEFIMAGGKRFYFMAEYPVRLPAESQSFMRLVLANGALHARLACGGVGVLNLANVVSYTIYPGIAQIPADTWLAERVARPS